MPLLDFVEKLVERSVRRNTQEVYEGLKRRIAPKKAYGPSVYTPEGDVLILLDTCRPDVFEEHAIPLLKQKAIEISNLEGIVRTLFSGACVLRSASVMVEQQNPNFLNYSYRDGTATDVHTHLTAVLAD